MKFNYKILHNYGNFLAVLKEIIFNDDYIYNYLPASCFREAKIDNLKLSKNIKI